MRKVVLLLMVIAALTACAKKDTDMKKEGEGKSIVFAKAGSSTITQADFEKEFQALPEYAQQMFEGEKGAEKFIDEIVKKEVLYQEAVKKGLDKTPEFTRKLEAFRKLTLATELLEKEIMTNAKVTEQEVKDYYDKHKEDFTTTSQIKASHILVKTGDEATRILARLKKGEKFEELAKKESIDKASAKNGGDLGYFARGQMVPEFEKAAAGLKAGELSDPVKTQFGYHIIKVTDRKSGPVIEFERIKDIIFQKLSGEKQKESFEKYISDLKKSYPVEIKKDALAKYTQGKEKTKKPAAVPDATAEGNKEEPKKEDTKQADPKQKK